MGPVTIIFGLALVGVGLVGYFGTGGTHPTALIPAFLGLALVLLGLLALKDSLRKHAMHIAAMLALVGFLYPAYKAIPKIAEIAQGVEVPDPMTRLRAAASQGATSVTCGVLLALCINSFIQARRRRKAAGVPSSG